VLTCSAPLHKERARRRGIKTAHVSQEPFVCPERAEEDGDGPLTPTLTRTRLHPKASSGRDHPSRLRKLAELNRRVRADARRYHRGHAGTVAPEPSRQLTWMSAALRRPVRASCECFTPFSTAGESHSAREQLRGMRAHSFSCTEELRSRGRMEWRAALADRRARETRRATHRSLPPSLSEPNDGRTHYTVQ
jgi:hypothetical protein